MNAISQIEKIFEKKYLLLNRAGTGSCSSPLSDVSGCMSGSQVKLRYQPCPDILQTESKGWVATITITKMSEILDKDREECH